MARIGPVIAEDMSSVLHELGDSPHRLRGATLLVTGASGFLCSYFVDTVATLNDLGLDPPCHVIAVDNLRTGVPERLAHLEGRNDVSFVRHDVTLPLAIDRHVDWIIHGASVASPTFYRRYPLDTIDVNVTGTRLMLELSRKDCIKSLLYLSTSEIYGDPEPAFIPTPEHYRGYVSCTGPRACYDESKRLAETLCLNYYRLFSVPVKIVRPFNVYGPGQPLGDGRIIPDLMKATLRRDPIELFSDGRATRAFCYVSDAIAAMWHVLLSDANGEVFNVGNDQEETSISALADKMCMIAGPPSISVERRTSIDEHYLTDNPRRRCPDLTKLRAAFSWEPKVSLTQGLSRTLRSYATEPVRQER
ncbi:MAG: NAD-dependent epimerase/dehydratase family protein [Candidatus Acidiferrales bacterium]